MSKTEVPCNDCGKGLSYDEDVGLPHFYCENCLKERVKKPLFSAKGITEGEFKRFQDVISNAKICDEFYDLLFNFDKEKGELIVIKR